MNSACDWALHYLSGSLSVLPIKGDGTKSPDLGSWKHLQQQPAHEQTIREWYKRHPESGVGIIGGTVSGVLEILDFDDASAWEAFRPLAVSLLHDSGVRLPKLPVVWTPSNGRHVYYRWAGPAVGNMKLAVRRNEEGVLETVIETRGEGGYVLAPGCPHQCHPTRNTYDLVQGDLGNIPHIDTDARDLLLNVARGLSEVREEKPAVAPRPRTVDGERPGDLYCAKAEWDGLLRRHGWTRVRTSGETAYWCRPGKKKGISASTNHDGTNYLYVWSSNAHPFDTDRGYSLFAAFALLDHGGDFAAAAHALAEQGYKSATPKVALAQPKTLGKAWHPMGQLARTRLSSAYPLS